MRDNPRARVIYPIGLAGVFEGAVLGGAAPSFFWRSHRSPPEPSRRRLLARGLFSSEALKIIVEAVEIDVSARADQEGADLPLVAPIVKRLRRDFAAARFCTQRGGSHLSSSLG